MDAPSRSQSNGLHALPRCMEDWTAGAAAGVMFMSMLLQSRACLASHLPRVRCWAQLEGPSGGVLPASVTSVLGRLTVQGTLMESLPAFSRKEVAWHGMFRLKMQADGLMDGL